MMMAGMCPTIEELEDYLGGASGPGIKARLDPHLSSCASCRALLLDVRENLGVADQLAAISAGALDGSIGAFLARPSEPRAECEDLPTPPGYRRVGEILRGGQGLVFRAVQESTGRDVAIKVLREGRFADAHERVRFEREIRILGQIQDPNIVTIHGSGNVSGRAFFVTDYVDGPTLEQYVRGWRGSRGASESDATASSGGAKSPPARPLNVRETLELFAKVADAVHAAHLRGVIHRDLKPSNIRVNPAGQPMILDFGLALLVGSQADFTRITDPGSFHGTLAYASPEQTRSRDDIDIRSDVYSLGVVLYELLTGRLPYNLRRVALPEAARIICEQAPATDAALRGELGSIVLKALHKDRERRYRSAADLAEDIQRHLNHRPIQARPQSAVYQLRKFVGRNRVASAVVGALLIGLVALAIVNGWLARRYADQRDAARLAAAEEQVARRSADEVVKFLESLLSGANPYAGRENEPTLAEVVSQAESRLGELDAEPLVQARVLTALGGVHVTLAKYDRANELLDRALAIRTAHLGSEHPDIAATLDTQCLAYSAAGQHQQAIATASKSLAIIEKARGREHLETAAAITSLGTMQFNARAFDGAVASFEEALAIRTRLLGDEHLDVADALGNLGNTYLQAGRLPEAVSLLRRCLEIRESRLGDSPGVCEAIQGLAEATIHTDREETLQLVERGLAVARRVYHAKHPAVADALNNLAFMLFAKNASAACDLYIEALAIRRESLGQDHPLVAATLNDLGNRLSERGDFAGAERCLAEALEIQRKHFGPRDLRVSHSMNSLSVTCMQAGKLPEAAELAEGVLDIWREIYGPEHVLVGVAHQNAGAIYSELMDWDRAEEHFRSSAEIYATSNPTKLADVSQLRGIMNLWQGRLDDAESQLRRALDIVRTLQPPEPLRLASVLDGLGVVLSLLDRPQEAREALEDSLRNYRQVLAPGDVALFRPLVDLAEVRMCDNARAAEDGIIEALALESKLLPADPLHGDLLAARGLLALGDDRPDEALAHLREALACHERRWGPGHWKTESTRARYGACLARLEQWTEALEALKASRPVLESTFGISHPETRRAADALSRLPNPTAGGT